MWFQYTIGGFLVLVVLAVILDAVLGSLVSRLVNKSSLFLILVILAVIGFAAYYLYVVLF